MRIKFYSKNMLLSLICNAKKKKAERDHVVKNIKLCVCVHNVYTFITYIS